MSYSSRRCNLSAFSGTAAAGGDSDYIVHLGVARPLSTQRLAVPAQGSQTRRNATSDTFTLSMTSAVHAAETRHRILELHPNSVASLYGLCGGARLSKGAACMGESAMVPRHRKSAAGVTAFPFAGNFWAKDEAAHHWEEVHRTISGQQTRVQGCVASRRLHIDVRARTVAPVGAARARGAAVLAIGAADTEEVLTSTDGDTAVAAPSDSCGGFAGEAQYSTTTADDTAVTASLGSSTTS